MAKSRVEKNKSLYDELESESFEIEDIGAPSTGKSVKKESPQENIAEEDIKKQELVPVKKKVKKNEVVPVTKKKESTKKSKFVVEQPLSYAEKLSVEELLRLKLEKQQKLKDDKRLYKRSPITDTYTAEMMQKNINQKDGVDVRKEVNINVRKGNNGVVIALAVLLVTVIAAGIAIAFAIL